MITAYLEHGIAKALRGNHFSVSGMTTSSPTACTWRRETGAQSVDNVEGFMEEMND
jgi:hypothetical protein